MENRWSLYSSDPLFAEATAALDAAWEQAKWADPSLPSVLRARNAVKAVRAVMEKYADQGATDTEPDEVLVYDLVNNHFNTDFTRWDV